MKFTSNKNQLLSTYLKSLDTPFKKKRDKYEVKIFQDNTSACAAIVLTKILSSIIILHPF